MEDLSLIVRFNDRQLVEFISSAEKRVFLSLPHIHMELAEALCAFSEDNSAVDIRIVIDNSEEKIRQGFGSVDAVELLRSTGIRIYENRKNAISFVIVDASGFFLFPQSRIFSYEDASENGVVMAPETLAGLTALYFPFAETEEKEAFLHEISAAIVKSADTVNAAIDAIVGGTKHPLPELNENQFTDIKDRIIKNPPDHPDLRRKMDVYTAKIQFVELHLKGANLKTYKIKIPKDMLPIKNAELRKAFETKMNLFEKLDTKKMFEPIDKLNEKMENIRSKYLIPFSSRNKSVIKKDDKGQFEEELEALKKEIKSIQKEIEQQIALNILFTKDKIRKELTAFLRENPPDHIKEYRRSLFDMEVDDMISKSIARIKFPRANELVGRLGMECYYYDITVSDFRNRDFLQELEKRNIFDGKDIEEIVQFSSAYEVKR